MNVNLVTAFFGNSALPADMFERTIDEMKVGEIGFTVPWALFFDEGKAFLRGEYSIRDDKGGTVQMEVGRTRSGYIVSVQSCDYKWSRTPPNGVSLPIPVINILHQKIAMGRW